MKKLMVLLFLLTGLLVSCEKSPFCNEEPPVDWLMEDCEYVDLDMALKDNPVDNVWCDGRMVTYRNVTKRVVSPLVIDPTCGYYTAGVVQYYWGEAPLHTVDYSIGNGRASKITYLIYNEGAPCENVRQGCYFQQPCDTDTALN